MRRALVGIVIAATLSGSGCVGTLVRLEAKGSHDEVIARAHARRWPPRRAAARALARSLVATGDVERARDVLLGDFRRGGQLPSLVALADLERTLGRDGVAAIHYARVLELDRTVLRGRRDVCALLVTRASAWVALGEGTAALDDLDAARTSCGIEDAPLRRRAEAHLAEHLRSRRSPPVCTGDCSPRPDPAAIGAAIATARATGPTALRELAAHRRLALPAADVIALLLADARGQAGARLVDDDELRMWIGDGDVDEFVAPVRALTVPEGSYLRLRLERAIGRSPDGGVVSPSQRAIWLDRASVIEGAVRWRILAVTGDMTAAEQDVVGRWRPRHLAVPATGEEIVAPTGPHWSLRTEVTSANLRELLVLARLRDAADDPDLGLELRRSALRAAEQAGLLEAGAALRDEVGDALAWGRPWLALAIADVARTADVEPLRRAAATGILLGAAACEGPCPESAADLDTIVRVLGEAWVDDQRATLRALAGARVQPRSPAGACPSLEEVLAPPTSTPLGRALVQARDGDPIGLARALVVAIESDPSLACGARLALPLLVSLEAGVTTARLSDFLAHGPAQTVAPVLTMHATLAVLGNLYTRAEHLGLAAAATGVPHHAWRELARYARAAGARDLEVLALREVLLHTGGFEDDTIRRELVAHTILDGARAWGMRDTPAGRESVGFVVDEHLARLHPAERWAERGAILDAVVARRSDAAVLEVVTRTLMPRERIAAMGLGADRAQRPGVEPRGGADGTWSPEGLGRLARAHHIADVPPSIAVFADARRMVALRRALAQDARDWGVRRRQAIGLAIAGGDADRAIGAAALMSMATPKSRPALERLLLGRPAALDDRSSAQSAGVGLDAGDAVVADDVVLLHVLLGLRPEAAMWLGRPAAGVP